MPCQWGWMERSRGQSAWGIESASCLFCGTETVGETPFVIVICTNSRGAYTNKSGTFWREGGSRRNKILVPHVEPAINPSKCTLWLKYGPFKRALSSWLRSNIRLRLRKGRHEFGSWWWKLPLELDFKKLKGLLSRWRRSTRLCLRRRGH